MIKDYLLKATLIRKYLPVPNAARVLVTGLLCNPVLLVLISVVMQLPGAFGKKKKKEKMATFSCFIETFTKYYPKKIF